MKFECQPGSFEDLVFNTNPGNPGLIYEKLTGMFLPDNKFRATTNRWEIASQLVPHDQAIAAGEQALEIIRHTDQLPYTETTVHGRGSFTELGAYDKNKYRTAKKTIFGYERSIEWAADLLDVIGTMQATWPQLKNPSYVYLDLYGPGETIPYHQDPMYDYTAIMELMFGSVITLNDKKLGVNFVQPQSPGDAYIMHHTENTKWAPWHAVEFPWARLALRLVASSPIRQHMEHERVRHGITKAP